MEYFVEDRCTVEFQRKTFTSGGAFIAPCSDGFARGVVYVKAGLPNGARGHVVTDWHGNTIARAELGPVYRGNFCKMQAVTFTLDGVRFHGRYCPDWANMVRVRSTKKVKGGK